MKRVIFLIILFSSLIIWTTGCKKEKVSGKPVTLQFFFYKQEIVNQLNEIVSIFKEKYPNISIETECIPNDSQTVLKGRLASGNAPDIMMLQSYSTVFEYAKAGHLLDITNEPFLQKVVDGAKNGVTYNQRIYALPLDIAGIGIIYNKDIFTKYNLSIPYTFKDLQNICDILNKNNITPFSVSIKDNWPLGHFFSMGHTALIGKDLNKWLESMNNGTGTFGDPRIDSLFQILDFYKKNGGPKAMEMDYKNQIANFASGNYAMMVQGLWAYGVAKSINPNLNAGFIAFPFTENPEDTKIYADSDSTLAISAKAKPENIAAAKLFFEFLTGPEGVNLIITKCNLIPTIKGAQVSGMDVPFQDLIKLLSENKTIPWAFQQWPTSVFEESKKTIQEYYSGQKSSKEVINYLDSLWKKEIGK